MVGLFVLGFFVCLFEKSPFVQAGVVFAVFCMLLVQVHLFVWLNKKKRDKTVWYR